MFNEEEKANYARHKLLREKPDVPLSFYILRDLYGEIPRCNAREFTSEDFETKESSTIQEDNIMSTEKIEANAYNPTTLQANKAATEDYLQSKSIAFFAPQAKYAPRFGWGNYQEFVDWNKSHASDEPATRRVFVK